MSMVITEQSIIEALRQLPHERWSNVLDFIQSQHGAAEPVGSKDKTPLTSTELLNSGLVGIWADRSDIGDSQEFARRLRHQAQTRSLE